METKELTNEDEIFEVKEEDIRKIQKELLKQAKKNNKNAPSNDVTPTFPTMGTNERQIFNELMGYIKSLSDEVQGLAFRLNNAAKYFKTLEQRIIRLESK